MLATTSLGAVWSSCSPDFGVQGVLDRFSQIEPKILIVADGYFYGGKEFDCLDRIKAITARLHSVSQLVVIPYIRTTALLNGLSNVVSWDDFLAKHEIQEIEYTQVPFNAPLYIMFSSGTTGCLLYTSPSPRD